MTTIPPQWYSGASIHSAPEDVVRKAIIAAIGGLLLLSGCGNQGDKATGIPAQPKWKGEPYRLTLDTPPAKPSPAGVTIPAVKFTANPDELEKRAILVVRFDSTESAKTAPAGSLMVLAPVDISGAEGALSADYMDAANKGLASFLKAYCVKGKVKVSVALARSSLSPRPEDAEVDSKRLSDWLPIDVVFKNPHPTC